MSKIKQAIGITLFESDDFGGPKIVGGGICPTQRANKTCCGVIEVMETEQKIGNIFGFTGGNYAGNVYDKDHLSPTLNTMQGGCKQPMIIDSTIVAMRGRNPTNPSDRTPGIELEQTFEVNQNGTTNCLTSVQKDNLVLEKPTQLGFLDSGTGKHQSNTVYDEKSLCPNITTIDGGGTQQIKIATDVINPLKGISENGWHFEQNVYDANGLVRSLKSESGSGNIPKAIVQYRIRKLTPKECWRLMDFSDEDFEKAAEVNSNTQLYKQAGNSIVKNVLIAIFGQMIPGKGMCYLRDECE